MTSTDIKQRLEKAQQTLEKRKSTIERHQKQAEKKLRIIQANGWELDKFLYCGNINREAYWAICEYETKLDDIKSATKKLAEAELITKNWETKLEKQIQLEITIETSIPEAFKKAREELVKQWVASDIRIRNQMRVQRANLDYTEFRKLYKYSTEEQYSRTDEEFKAIEEKEANIWLINLYDRVKEITGEVTDCSKLYWGGKCLDGFVTGENGKAKVETIGAGGYNIQRYHLRVLVHEVK